MQGIRVDVLHAQAARRRAAGDRGADAAACRQRHLRGDVRRRAGRGARALAGPAPRRVRRPVPRRHPRAIAKRCARGSGWTPLFPLFGSDTAALAREMIRRRPACRRVLRGYAATRCGVQWPHVRCGPARSACRPAVDPCGENGEFHTCVSAGPMFAQPLALERGETVLRDGRFAYTDFILAA